jgi:hypothetical protein
MVASGGILFGSYSMYKSNKAGERMNQMAEENAMYRTKVMKSHTHYVDRNILQRYRHVVSRTLAKPLISTTVFPVATRRLAAS